MNRTTTVIAGVAAVLGGVALVIIADRQGWLGSGNAPAPVVAPASVSQFTPKPRPAQPSVTILPASNVTEAALPRTQREPSSTCENASKMISFDSAAIADAAGLRWASVRTSAVTHMLACNVELAFNGDRMAHIASRAPGVVQRVLHQSGDSVKAGDVLAVIDSSELGGAKAAVQQANAVVRLWTDNLARFNSLSGGAVTQQELIEAETKLAEARIDLSRGVQHLRNLGLEQAAIDAVLASDDSSSALSVVAPFDGLIVERHAVLGEVIDTNEALFAITDTSTMWAMLDVRESDMRLVELGQRVQVSLPGLAGETFAGEIAWVSAAVDPTTRTLKARANLPNAAGVLRANMFGKANIIAADAEPSLVVPRDAVQWDGCCNLVFVRQTDRMFQPFKVRLGADLGERFVVLDGLREGDEIVTEGGFLLRTQLLKDSIGAGCCEAGGIKTE